jgi:hypothetical protein
MRRRTFLEVISAGAAGVLTGGLQKIVATAALGGVKIATSLGLSLLRNRGLAAKDILLDLAGGCFRQLGHKLDSLGTLEVRQMITSVIAQLGFRRGRACF